MSLSQDREWSVTCIKEGITRYFRLLSRPPFANWWPKRRANQTGLKIWWLLTGQLNSFQSIQPYENMILKISACSSSSVFQSRPHLSATYIILSKDIERWWSPPLCQQLSFWQSGITEPALPARRRGLLCDSHKITTQSSGRPNRCPQRRRSCDEDCQLG